MPDSSSSMAKSKFTDYAFKALALVVIPVFGWVIRLEVTNAIQNERISELQEDVQKNSNIAVAVQQNTTSLVKLETKLDAVGKNIDEIKRLLSSQ